MNCMLAIPPGFLSAPGVVSLFGNSIYTLVIPPEFIIDVSGNPATINPDSPGEPAVYRFALERETIRPFFVPLSDVPLVFETNGGVRSSNDGAVPLSGVIELTLSEYVIRNPGGAPVTVQLYHYEAPNVASPSPEELRLFATYDLVAGDPSPNTGAYLRSTGSNKFRIQYNGLPGGTEFYVKVDRDAFVDFSFERDHAMYGMNTSLPIDVDTYRFTTETDADNTAPTIEHITLNDSNFPDATPTYYQEVPVGMAGSTFLNVALETSEFVLRFSEPVEQVDLSEEISLTGGRNIVGPLIVRRAGTEWVLHFENLVANTSYTFEFRAGFFEDNSGNRNDPVSITFRTLLAPPSFNKPLDGEPPEIPRVVFTLEGCDTNTETSIASCVAVAINSVNGNEFPFEFDGTEDERTMLYNNLKWFELDYNSMDELLLSDENSTITGDFRFRPLLSTLSAPFEDGELQIDDIGIYVYQVQQDSVGAGSLESSSHACFGSSWERGY